MLFVVGCFVVYCLLLVVVCCLLLAVLLFIVCCWLLFVVVCCCLLLFVVVIVGLDCRCELSCLCLECCRIGTRKELLCYGPRCLQCPVHSMIVIVIVVVMSLIVNDIVIVDCQ